MNTRIPCLGAVGILWMSILIAGPSHASVTMTGTRVVFPGQKNEISIRLQNQGKGPTLVQAWIDDGDPRATPATAKAPFVLRPPIFRMDAGKMQVIRVALAGEALPQDRESLYWFNVRDVPATTADVSEEDGGRLHLIIRTRAKLFYRPKSLTVAGAMKAPQQLDWRLQRSGEGCTLSIGNATPYHVNLNTIGSQGSAVAIGDGVVAPFGTARHALTPAQCGAMKSTVHFEYVNDYGAAVAYESQLRRD